MGFLYPRTIAIHRPKPNVGVGVLGYSGETAAAEDLIAQRLPASIQQRRARGGTQAGLPGDAPNRTGWWIFIPKAKAALGLITERDVVIDDLSKRYQVVAAYWNSLGYRLLVELLEI